MVGISQAVAAHRLGGLVRPSCAPTLVTAALPRRHLEVALQRTRDARSSPSRFWQGTGYGVVRLKVTGAAAKVTHLFPSAKRRSSLNLTALHKPHTAPSLSAVCLYPPHLRGCHLSESSICLSSCRLRSAAWRSVLTGDSSTLKHAQLDGVFVSITPGDPSLWVGVIFVRKGSQMS